MPDDPSEPASPPDEGAKWTRGLLISLLVAVLVGVAFFGGAVVSAGFGFLDSLRETERETVVRPAPSVVVAVRDLARLETTNFHMERVIDINDKETRAWGWIELEDKLLLVAAADITAGVDLSKLEDDDVRADPATGQVELTLPHPEILTTVLDTERTYVHTRDTDLLAKRKEDLESRARKLATAKLRDAALDAGILDRAKAGAERAITGLLQSSGYDEVVIRWK